MSQSYTEGGAGPSLAAHSKDGSVGDKPRPPRQPISPLLPPAATWLGMLSAMQRRPQIVSQVMPGTWFPREAVKQPINWVSSCASSRCWP
jgi:hypothetical protein